MRKPFADWDLENFVGLAMLVCLTLLLVSGMAAICFGCWAATRTPVLAVIGLTAYAVTTPAPEQTIIQRVETTGDVKRLCIEAKTDGRVDAMSCELIDPQSGGVK